MNGRLPINGCSELEELLIGHSLIKHEAERIIPIFLVQPGISKGEAPCENGGERVFLYRYPLHSSEASLSLGACMYARPNAHAC